MIAAGIRPTHLEDHMGCLPGPGGAFAGAMDALWHDHGIPFMVTAQAACREAHCLPVTAFHDISLPLSFQEKKVRMMQILETLPEGLNWICAHPAADTEEMRAAGIGDRWGAGTRSTDMQVLSDPDVKVRVEELQIRLINALEAAEVAEIA